MFMEYLRIVEDGFYFRGIIINLPQKKSTGLEDFYGKLSNFDYVGNGFGERRRFYN